MIWEQIWPRFYSKFESKLEFENKREKEIRKIITKKKNKGILGWIPLHSAHSRIQAARPSTPSIPRARSQLT
jgi:hypothetical protein